MSLNFIGKMSEHLSELSKFLLIFLENTFSTYSNDWWNENILRALTDQQIFDIVNEKSSLQYLDLLALLRVFYYNWNRISKDKKINFNKKTYILELQNIRNKWAHINNEILEHEDIYRDLDTIQRFLNIICADKDFIERVKQDKMSILSKFNHEQENIKLDKVFNLNVEKIQYKELNAIKVCEKQDTSLHINNDKSVIIINGVKIPTERNDSQSESYFKTVIPLLLQVLSEEDIVNLQKISYCKNVINIKSNRHPLLSTNKSEMYDQTNRFRAYKNKISGYWVYSQWGKHNLPEWKNYLIALEAKYNGQLPYNLSWQDSDTHISKCNKIKELSLDKQDRSFVIIKGIKIYTERLGNNSKDYFKDIIPKLLQILPESEIKNLQSITYCYDKVKTGIAQFPILSVNKNEMTDKTGRFRAYSKKIANFWVSAQWNEINLIAWKNYLNYISNSFE